MGGALCNEYPGRGRTAASQRRMSHNADLLNLAGAVYRSNTLSFRTALGGRTFSRVSGTLAFQGNGAGYFPLPGTAGPPVRL